MHKKRLPRLQGDTAGPEEVHGAPAVSASGTWLSDPDSPGTSTSDIFYPPVDKSLSIQPFYGSRYALSVKKMAHLRNTPT